MSAGAGGSKVAVVAAVIGNLAIAVIKFIAASMTGSSAMIAEGIHSLVDTGNGGLMLLGMRKSTAPADDAHPFGHGKEIYFWTLIVAISIFGIGGGMSVYEGIVHLIHPSTIEDATASYVVLAISVLVEGWSFSVAMRQLWRAKGTRGVFEFTRVAKDPSLFTVVFEDSAAMVGLVVAFLGVFLGHQLQNPYFDGGASVIIGLLLMGVAFLLARESKGLLIGEGVEPDVLARMREVVESDPAVEKVGLIRTAYFGPSALLVNIDVVFRPRMRAEKVAEASQRIEDRLKALDPDVSGVYLEASSLASLASDGDQADADAGHEYSAG